MIGSYKRFSEELKQLQKSIMLKHQLFLLNAINQGVPTHKELTW